MLESPRKTYTAMKHVAIVMLCVSFASTAFAQKSGSGLTLEGTILTASPAIIAPEGWVDRRQQAQPPGSERLLIKLDLYLRLKNDGPTPLLVLDPVRCFCDKSIEFFSNIPYTVDGETAVVRTMQKTDDWRKLTRPTVGGYDYFASFLKGLSASPNPGSTVLKIEPGTYYDFRDSITIDEGYHIEWRAGKSTRELRGETVFPDYPAFRVEYKLTVKGRQDFPGLFGKLRERWKKSGDFVIVDDEEVLLRSLPIINIPGR
jgi:hypothetical protein